MGIAEDKLRQVALEVYSFLIGGWHSILFGILS
jgi:hypothetical protein